MSIDVISPTLTARDVTFSYERDKTPLIEGWSHSFYRGSTTAITGPSGCGKSTSLYILGLMLRMGAGSILLDNVRVDSLSDRERAGVRAHHFGFVFQDASLDPTRSVLDNVLETAVYRGDSLVSATATAHALLEELGVDLPSHRRPGQISGGQAQRVALCRALLGGPKVILADEPTGNLDVDTARVVLAALEQHARRGAAVIIVTHDERVTSWADHTIALGKPL